MSAWQLVSTFPDLESGLSVKRREHYRYTNVTQSDSIVNAVSFRLLFSVEFHNNLVGSRARIVILIFLLNKKVVAFTVRSPVWMDSYGFCGDRILWAIGVMAGVMAHFMCLLGQAVMLNDLTKQVSRHCSEQLTSSTISCL